MRRTARTLIQTLNGPQEPGRSPVFWILFAACFVGLLVLPNYLSRYELLTASSFLLMGFMAVGLSLIWGYGGILSFGQSAFFGVGGYAYGIVGINLAAGGASPSIALTVLGGLLVPVLLAAVLGYIMFYARIRGVYVAIMMLVTTLLIQTFMNQTAGAQWRIGHAHLGGNNGLGRFAAEIHEPPSLQFALGDRSFEFWGPSPDLYYLIVILLFVVYLALRCLVNSRFGFALTASREDQDRTESLGYDVRLIQLAAFCIGAALAGLSGILYVSWGNFIEPSVFGITANVMPIIWVAVAGRKSLAAAIVGAVAIQWLSQSLAIEGEYALVVLGFLLILAVTVLPEGIVSLPSVIRSHLSRLRTRLRKGRPVSDGAATAVRRTR